MEPKEELPRTVEPMLATAGNLPDRSDLYAYEFKWDGIRAIVTLAPDVFRIQTRHGGDTTGAFPELRELRRAVGRHTVVLDGEVVCLDEKGRPRFNRIQHRIHRAEPPTQALADAYPASFLAFDLLHLDGAWLFDLPYLERRRRLEGLGLEGPHWSTPPYQLGSGAAILKSSRDLGFEGVVAKSKESTYRPGTRSRAWIKVKNWNRQEFVVAGWIPGEGGRSGAIGSLLLGYYERSPKPPRLVYAGRAGTGFTAEDAEAWLGRLRAIERKTSPFAEGPVPQEARFADPRYVVEVTFGEWTPDRVLRHPTYLGLRADKKPEDVVLETKET